MSEQKRASLTTIGTVNSDKKSEIVSKKTTRIVVTLSEPNEDSCPVFDYTRLCRSEEKKRLLKKQKPKPNGSLLQSDDDDDDVRRIARQFEEKYGTGEKKHQSRCQTYAELGAGYDETDSFIDNTDAYDEALPEEFQTPCGGYYINSGRLEFKRVELSDHSDIDEIIARRRKQRKVKVMDEEKEEDDDNEEEEEENEASNDNENESTVKVKEEQKKEVELTAPKKVKISEDKVAEQSSAVNDKPAGTVLPNVTEIDNVKAKKRKLQIQGTPEDIPSAKQKKKALTVKALLEEKRVSGEPSGATDDSKKLLATSATTNYTSVNDIIESVVRGKEDSNSSSVLSKSQSDSGPSLDSEESQETKSSNTPSTPLPDGLLPEAVELVFRIKHLAATTSVLTRKALSEDINNCLISLDWNTRDLPSALKHSLYSHLSCYLPCTKDTLIKRTKKLIVQREEEKLKEPMKKLKAAVDAMMPVLLDKYNKECHRLAEEQGQEAAGNSTSYKVARRKFPWNDELRGYLREMITVQLHCFNVMKLRKETSEAYVTKFLNTHVRVLWPPGWMKTSTLLREGRNSSLVKPKKHSLNGIETSNKNAATSPRIGLSPLQGNTTLTSTNATVLPTYSRTEQNNFQHKLPSTTSVIPTKPHSSKSTLLESNNLSKITSISSSTVLPKKSHSPGNSVTISPVKKESFSVDALLKKNLETGFSSEVTDIKKDSVSVITMNGSPMPFKDLSLRKLKKEECGSNSGDKILDLSNCTSKQQHSVIQNISSNERTTVTNGESVNICSAEEIKTVVNSGLLSTKPKEAMASLLMSRKQRILQDSQCDDLVKPNLIQDTARCNETTANNVDHRKYKKSDTKKKHKNDFDKEMPIPPSLSKCLKSPPPYIISQEAERRMNEETATATDILSQIINESLLGTPTPHQHQRTYEEEAPEERKMKPRTMSGDHEAKVNQEVDQVIQDLVELRQMSGGTGEIIDNSKANYNSNPLGLHHAKNLDIEETSKHSPYSSFQDEFFKHLLKKDTQLPPIPPITKPTSLPRHSIGPFDNSLPYTEDIPTKPSLYNSLPHCTTQSISQHNVIPSSSKSAQMNHGNTSSLGLPTGTSESSPPH